ncbi:MAG: hypothetical protein ACLPVY_02150 [Acidimicrobiia bacterium]
MRSLRVFVILVLSAALGLFVLWTVGPHSKPGSSTHGTQILAFLAVVGVCVLASRRVWHRQVSH